MSRHRRRAGLRGKPRPGEGPGPGRAGPGVAGRAARRAGAMAKAYDHLFKLLLIGDSGVGKTCLIIRFAEDNFTSTYISTIGIDFKIRTVDIDGKKIKLQVWDTAGQERFKTITTAYYRGAVGIILVYDITDAKSFENIQNWMKSIKENASAGVERLLIGNKCDMEAKRKVQRDEAEKGAPLVPQLAKEHGIRFFETSAKSSVNVEEAFSTLARDILQKSSRKAAPSSNRPLLESGPPRKAGGPAPPVSPSCPRASRWRRSRSPGSRSGNPAAPMGPRGLSGPRCCALCAVLGALAGLALYRPAAAAMVANDERRSASPVAATPCWRLEDFVVAQECARCSSFQAKTLPECSRTGFIEKINCATSKREEYKSCRSAVMEARVFWRFVGSMMCVAAVFAVLVVWRQRVLDRKALEKVRKQIESI